MDKRAERKRAERLERKLQARAKAEGIGMGEALFDYMQEELIGLPGAAERREYMLGFSQTMGQKKSDDEELKAAEYLRNLAMVLDDFDERMGEDERLELIASYPAGTAQEALRRRAETLKERSAA